MAIGKPRGNNRPYGGSRSSTVTTVVVLAAVCIFGIWRLITTSNSNTTTTLQIKQDDSSTSSFVKLNPKLIPRIDHHATTKDKLLSVYNNNTSNSSDQDGLIDQHDDHDDDESKTQINQETGQNNINKPDDDGDWLAEPENEPKQESTSSSSSNIIIIDDDDAEDSLNDSDVGKQEAEQHQEEAKEEQEIEISTLSIEDNTNDHTKEEHEQKAQNNIKETNDDDHQQITDDDSGNHQDDKLIVEDDIRDLEDNQEITDDQEHEKGIENQQEQNEDDDDGPIKSHSIAAKTKARVENQEALDIRNKMEQAKIESTTIPMIKDSNVEYSTHVPKFDNVISESDKWELCNVTTGTDYIPCLDNEIAIGNSPQFERKERHCPDEPPVCLVPLPEAYKTPIPWPQSRDKIWFHNVPNKALSDLKQLQNSVKVTGEFITFPKGALHYIDFLQEAVPEIAWGNHTRVVLDVGCGVASFGGYLFDKDVLAMSIASKDEQEAQIQFALERGIPAISSVIGSTTQRLPFPSRVFDLVHCVRCKVPWHKDGGIHLLEVNRVLRPGGYFVWSATPVYRTLEEDVQVWKEMSALTVAMCWELVTIKKDRLNAIGVAVYHKPESNECYNVMKKQQPPICKPDDDPNYAWYVPLQTCMHMVPMRETERGSHWPEAWPARVQEPPYWLNESHVGFYGKPAPNDFKQDYEHWKRVISKSYMSDLGINWSNVRNVMDMRAVYGGFAAALKDLKLWVLNVDSADSDTLTIIFERGLLGIYHDWCESFSTFPRTYDLLHADHLFSNLKNRCKIKAVMAEIDRILRPGGNLIVRDEPSMIWEMEKLLKSLHWEVNSTPTNEQEGVISGRKSMWRPTTYIKPS